MNDLPFDGRIYDLMDGWIICVLCHSIVFDLQAHNEKHTATTPEDGG
jgi:hypothetical protein